jgi:ceramide glucosyltransferase
VAWLLAALTAGSLVYCVLVVVAARRYLWGRLQPAADFSPPVSVLKPLHGLEPGLESNLRSFFEQDYPSFEVLLAFRDPADPARPLVERLQREYAHVPARVILTGEPPWANAKVWSLDRMTAVAQHDLLVMSDSDIRVNPHLLRELAREFADAAVGLSTCPYRAVAGPSLWSRLEAIGMNTEFIGGVLVARMLEGMKFALGPTIAARREVIESVGGWEYLKDFLAEDFVLGNRAAALGYRVILSSYVIEHHIGSQPLATNFRHRIRWHRSTRRSRPAGYVGQLFTNPLPLALLTVAAAPAWWPLLAVTAALRYTAAYATAKAVLWAPIHPFLLPVQDLFSFGFWVAGFFGNSISWRGRRYVLKRDGRFELRA